MADAITKDNVSKMTWKNIFDLINAIPDPDTRATKWVFSSFPDKRIDEKAVYPIITITPSVITNWESVTFKSVKVITGRNTVSVFTTNAEQMDEISDLVFSKVNDNTSTLYGNNIISISVDSTSYSSFERKGFKVHMKTMSLKWEFHFNR